MLFSIIYVIRVFTFNDTFPHNSYAYALQSRDRTEPLTNKGAEPITNKGAEPKSTEA